MKFLIKKDDLIFGLQKVQRAVSSRSPLAVLTGILFCCNENNLSLYATDMEISINCSVPVNVIEQGSLVIPSKYISEFAKKLPDVPIEFETIGDSNLVTIRYGQSEFNINGFSATDFPSFPAPEKEFLFNVNTEHFKNIIKKINYALSHEDTRPVFTGVLLEIDGDEAIMVATDTFRMAIKKFKIDNKASSLINIIIPGKTLNEVFRIISNNSSLKIIISKNHITFENEDMIIISRLISGKFPSFRQVIPSEFNCCLKVSIKEMLDAAERTSLLAGEKNSLIMFQTIKEGVIISVRSQSGWIREEISTNIEGENFDIIFNVRYLCDVLKSCDGEEISISITGSCTPALLTPSDDPEYISIIVPARNYKE